MKIITQIVLFILIYSCEVLSQVEVSTRLQEALNQANQNDYIKVLVLLRSQVDIAELDQQLYSQKSTLQQRAFQVITALKQNAENTQGEMKAYLNEKSESSEVFTYQAFWISNLFMVEAKPNIINELMTRLDVAEIDLDAILELDKPTEIPENEIESIESVEPGIKIINAHLLWAIGITGQGRLVMGIDTGVYPNHPALNHKWRGNTVPSSQAWFDPGGGTTTPNDCDGHGSHTVGTMVGRSITTADTIGVAIDAQWIAAKTICTSPHTSNSIAAFQWALNPDGNPGTINDMPDAINNSWYDPSVTDECSGLYKTTFDALEAAGIAIVFSAGNSGPGTSTITKPKNINTNEVSVFCVANINGATYLGGSNDPITSSSSRGPSTCGGTGSLLIKPEVSAPGTSVRSSGSATGYTSLTGTSMAAPHVAGAVALLKQAFPNLTGKRILEALYNTARDLGTAGEDNTYGMGLIDVYSAFLSLGTPDTTAPDLITDLSTVSPTSNSLSLQWTVPFDSSTNGITAYDIRYSLTPINDTIAFNNATPITFIGTPGAIGSTETIVISGLNFSTPYYFSVKSSDMWGNWSNISNLASGTTWVAPVIAVNPSGINHILPPQTIITDTITISNLTESPSTLDFTVSLENNTFPDGLLETKLIPKISQSVELDVDMDKNNPAENNGITIDGQGGPDIFGYKWIDSNDPNGPAYVWNDISANPNSVQVTIWTGSLDDGYTNAIPIGFNYNFYGNDYTNIHLSTNGFLSFTSLTSSHYTNSTVPNSAAPNNLIALFWDDLDGRTQGSVHYLNETDKFTVQYTNWQIYSATGSITCQVVLYADGRIMMYYNNMNATLTSATVGIENAAGSDGLLVLYNAAYITNGLAIKFSADPDWLSNSISGGTIYNNNSIDLILSFNSSDFPLGIYTMDVVINSNDPINPTITVPASMQIAFSLELTSLTALIEGFYNGSSMTPDTITVELRDATVPYSLIDQAKILLNSAGQGSAAFYNAVNGTQYYLVLKHRNAVETWSALPLSFTLNALSYDFTTASNKAFGNNLKQIGTKWCLYSGDINQDGFVNTQDLNLIFTTNVNGVTGYSSTDVNGDMYTEIEDLTKTFYNSVFGVERKRPLDFPGDNLNEYNREVR